VPSDHDRHLETTNTHFYAKLPAIDTAMAATTRPRGYFDPNDRTHYNTSKLFLDSYDRTVRDNATETAGSKGARGEISRRPGESGNVYGASATQPGWGQGGLSFGVGYFAPPLGALKVRVGCPWVLDVLRRRCV
jgi:hypothetical protein